MKNVGSTVVSHFVPGALVLRKDCCAVQRCVIRAVRLRWEQQEENWVHLGGLVWP